MNGGELTAPAATETQSVEIVSGEVVVELVTEGLIETETTPTEAPGIELVENTQPAISLITYNEAPLDLRHIPDTRLALIVVDQLPPEPVTAQVTALRPRGAARYANELEARARRAA
jgi:hypothetical protein